MKKIILLTVSFAYLACTNMQTKSENPAAFVLWQDSYAALLRESNSRQFAIYDVDNDGKPELFISKVFENSAKTVPYDVYTYINGASILLGEVKGLWGGIVVDGRGGILTSYVGAGGGETWRQYIKNGSLHDEGAIYGYQFDEDGTEHKWFVRDGASKITKNIIVTNETSDEYEHIRHGEKALEVYNITEATIAQQIYGVAEQACTLTMNDIIVAQDDQIFFAENGEPAHGVLCAAGEEIRPLSRWFERDFALVTLLVPLKNGLRHGIEIETVDGMLSRETPFKNGKIDGIERLYRDLHQRESWGGWLERKMSYVNGVQHGLQLYINTNYTIGLEQTYINGQEHGILREWQHDPYNSTTTLIVEQPVGVAGIGKRYYQSGELKREVYYDENYRKQGIGKAYYQDGTLQCEVNFEDGLQQGTARYYYSSGDFAAELLYKDGKAVSGKWYYGTEIRFDELQSIYENEYELWSDAMG